LLRWNARINLTAIRNPEEIVSRHFGESFFLARHLFPKSGEGVPLPAPAPKGEPRTTNHRPPSTRPDVIDLGSGAGFPGLPVKIWAPEIHLTLIESNHKKAAFLREVARALTLTDVDVIAERAQSAAGRLKADVVTFRAVENFDRTLSLAFRFLAPGGSVAILVGSAQLPSAKSGRALEIELSTSTSPLAASQDEIHPPPFLRWQTYHVPQSQKRTLAITNSPPSRWRAREPEE
jgi:16S rRNA (guanine527-N7)-methyltransferase